MACLVVLAGGAPRAETLSVSGGKIGSIDAWLGPTGYFLDLDQAARLYGAQLYWSRVSGGLRLSLRGRSLRLTLGGKTARLDGKTAALDAAVLLRSSRAFAPLSFFEAEAFSDWAGADTSFDPEAKRLSVAWRATVGRIRWAAHEDYTRLVAELGPRAPFHASPRGTGGLEISFPYGHIASAGEVRVKDRFLASYALSQGARAAKLVVRFRRPGLQWRTTELDGPRRLVLDIAADLPPDVPPEPASPPLAPLPLRAAPPRPGHRRPRIVIDAGHGGKDPGATGVRGTQEKDITLRAALDLEKLLKRDGRFEVLMTRTDDRFVALSDRSKLANESGADLFVSLHCNASGSSGNHGFEVYSMSEKASDPAAQELADRENASVALEGSSREDVQAQLLLLEMGKTENINESAVLAALIARDLDHRRIAIHDNGVKQAGFYVLRGTHAPAILFEMAYLTNRKDEAKLRGSRFRRKLMAGVFAGIKDYAGRRGWL
ncbi:MAG: N-acetylmuramoyl-L-alanine amidase [Elusimicrobia bacterium]|nr:N-acetylmuramoyl-L-alanine amidase [Elusimicrobiota bacterium]MDE2236821.1 N-acetylmuramoyl-L-alanine amidase [Elusimicrobiota bacterium]